MYFHIHTFIYKMHFKSVGFFCSICGHSWGFSFQYVIIMKTGEKFHVEKEIMIACVSLSQKDLRKAKT